jgi:GNAT superfamily N-acetyltransferase
MATGVAVRPVHGRGDLKKFIDLPYRLHARDPLWVPPLRRDVATLLDRRKNPFFEHAEAEYFLAERDGRVVGRIAAIHNRLHNETHGDRVGFFGFFEAENDQAIADALLDRASEWIRARGLDVLRGPASFSVNDECGLLVDGFESPPTLMMPHNPRYYVDLIERAGFATAKNLYCYEGTEPTGEFAERLTRGIDLIKKRFGVELRPLDMKDFHGEVERVKAIYNAAWEKNWGFVPMTEHEIDHLAEQFKPVVVPDLAPFVMKDGKPIAFALALPDLNVAFKRNPKGGFLRGVVTLLWMLKRRKIHRLRILLLGTLPEYRGKGLDAALYHWIWRYGTAYGITWGEAGWILEDNAAMNRGMEMLGWTRYKTYRLYDRSA